MIQNNPHRGNFRFVSKYLSIRVFYPAFVIFLLLLSGCEEENSLIGLDILPPTDKLRLKFTEINEVKAFTFTLDSVSADQVSFQLLGDLNDPVTGIANADFFTQFSFSSFGLNFGASPQADSLFLTFRMVGVFGDPGVTQEIKVYELLQDIRTDSVYYSNTDPSGYYQPGGEIAAFSYTPGDNDTVIKIPITDAGFIQKIFDMDSTSKSSYNDFIKYFKGFYVTSERQGDPGSILRLNLLDVDSRMTLHYRNSEKDSLTVTFPFAFLSRKINLFRHDFSGTVFYSQLNQTITQDSVAYVKSMAGLTTKLLFPDMTPWRDSMPVAINRALLILPVEKKDVTTITYPIPSQLILLVRNEEGGFTTFADYEIGSNYFGGRYDSDLEAYVFNISLQVQKFISGKLENLEFYVLVQDNSTSADRLVLTTGRHTRPVRLQITYHKY